MLGRLLISLVCAASLFAQTGGVNQAQAGDEPTASFRITTDEVIVPITVSDQEGRFVSDLDVEDFRIFDQGVEQKITFFSRERNQPMVIGFLIDQSHAMSLHWKRFQDAAIELVLALMPTDDERFSGYLISYHTQAELLVNTTSDVNELLDAVRDMKPGGGSALFDGIYMAMTSRELVVGEPIEPRRVLVVMGDGHDNASSRSLEQVLELAQRNMITIYCLSTVPFEQVRDEESNLARLAEATGGRVEYPLDDLYQDVAGYHSNPQDSGNYAYTVGTGAYNSHIMQGIFDSVAAVAGEIQTQYILRYRPTTTDSPRIFRNVRVEVALPNVQVRHRRGYYPNEP